MLTAQMLCVFTVLHCPVRTWRLGSRPGPLLLSGSVTLDQALISLGISVLICACFTSTQGLTCYINRDVSSDGQ